MTRVLVVVDDPQILRHANGLLVITLHGDQVPGLTRFESHTLRPFGLPRAPSRWRTTS